MDKVSRRQFSISTLNAVPAMVAGTKLFFETSQPALGQSSQKIRVGQIGTKHGHAAGKLETIRKFDQHFELVGVVEEDSSQRLKVENATAYKGCNWMTQEELLNQLGLQLVMIETEINKLLEVAERCLLAGTHIHLDKPAGTSYKHFQRVTQIASEKKRTIQLGYMFRSNPAFQFLFDAVKQGWLGEVFEVNAVMSKKLPVNERADVARYHGGSMFELGCHLIDAVVTLLGKPQSITPYLKKTQPDLDQLHDNCLAVFEYPNAVATIRSSMVEQDGGRRRQFTVCGTSGTIEIYPLEPAHLTLTLEKPFGKYRAGTQVVELPKTTGRYDGDLISLASAIRGESAYEYSLEHDLLVQECVLRASDMF